MFSGGSNGAVPDWMVQADLADGWKRSSFCDASSGNCAEVRELSGDLVAVRSSRLRDKEATTFTGAEWDALVAGVRAGEFDRLG